MDARNDQSNDFNFSEDDFKALFLIKIVGSSLSIIATLFLILLYLYLFSRTRCRGKRQANLLEVLMKKADTNTEVTAIDENAYLSDENEVETSLSRWRRMKKKKNKTNKLKIGLGNDLIFGYSTSNLIYNAGTFLVWSMSNVGTDTCPTSACKMQGFLKTFGILSNFSWMSSISHCFLISTKLSNLRSVRYYAILYLILSVLVPLILSIYFYVDNRYTFTTFLCALRIDFTKILQLVYIVICFIINVYCSVTSRFYFKSRLEEIKQDESKQNEANIIEQYLIFLWLTPTIMFFAICTATTKIIYLFVGIIKVSFIVYFEACVISVFSCVIPVIYIFYFRQVLQEFKCVKDEKLRKNDLSLNESSLTQQEMNEKAHISSTETSAL